VSIVIGNAELHYIIFIHEIFNSTISAISARHLFTLPIAIERANIQTHPVHFIFLCISFAIFMAMIIVKKSCPVSTKTKAKACDFSFTGTISP